MHCQITCFGSILALAAAPIASQSPQTVTQPFAVVANQGQWDGQAAFRIQKGGAAAWFLTDGWMFDLAGNRSAGASPGLGQGSGQPQNRTAVADRDVGHALRLTFLKSASDVRLQPESRMQGQLNFYLGNDPRRWRTNVPGYSQLRYRGMYPGIDVVIREGGGLFAYDIHCAAGSDHSQVRIRLSGADRIELTEDGHLRFYTPIGALVQSAPVAWQVLPNGKHLPVECRFVRSGEEQFGFRVDGRRADLPLVIDPDWYWGTLFGGSAWEDARNIAKHSGTGAAAKMTISGHTRSTGLPMTTGPRHAGAMDVMVAHFDPTKTGTAQRVWATYLGGSDIEYAYDVAVDIIGNTFVCGLTRSSSTTGGFPVTTGALQATFAGGTMDGYLSKLDGRGALSYSTLLGGSGDDRICRIHVAPGLVITISGYTNSSPKSGGKLNPTTGAFRTTIAGRQDAFVAILSPAATTINYLTYYGGSNWEGWPFQSANPFYYDMGTMGLDVDAAGRILVSGGSWSPSIPFANPTQTTNGGSADAFLALIDSSKTGNSQLVYGSFFGGQSNEGPECIRFDPTRANHFVVGGWTYSSNLRTTTGSFNPTFVGTPGTPNHNDAFLTWIDMSKTGTNQVTYSTFVSGTEWEGPSDLFVDSRGAISFGGWCGRAFPTTPGAYRETYPTGVTSPGYVARLYPGGKGKADLVYSTLGGGSGAGNSYVGDVVSDGAGGILFSGNTSSSTFPTPGGPYGTNRGGRDGYIAHLWGLNHGVRVIGRPTPASCAGSLNFGAQGLPSAGNKNFALSLWNAQPNQLAFLGLGTTLTSPVQLCAANLGINPLVVLGLRSDARGEIRIPAPVPTNLPPNTVVSAQVMIANSGCCLTSTHVLEIKP